VRSPTLVIANARIVTLAGPAGPRRGRALAELSVIPRGDVLVRDGRIAAVGAELTDTPDADIIDAAGRVLLPGFVDCHTHGCWAGNRLDEWELKRRGVPYLDILRRGGGILATVKAVRATAQSDLATTTYVRLQTMLREGTTTAELKSGYGLTTADELKMLRAICQAAKASKGTVVPTALLGHAIEGEREAFVRRTIDETLPAVAAEFPGITIDAYCENGAWSLDDCERLFRAAQQCGLPIRVHADQFHALGMTAAAIKLGAKSVDHLEATTDSELRWLASSETFGVILPATGFHTDGRYARGREFVELGGALALASNCNPGTAPTHSIPFAIALAVRHCGLSPAEAIVACTANAATLLGLPDRGTIEVGKRADLNLLRFRDERLLAYEIGGNPVDLTVCGGEIVSRVD
jgi:imidazolonepropionase